MRCDQTSALPKAIPVGINGAAVAIDPDTRPDRIPRSRGGSAGNWGRRDSAGESDGRGGGRRRRAAVAGGGGAAGGGYAATRGAGSAHDLREQLTDLAMERDVLMRSLALWARESL